MITYIIINIILIFFFITLIKGFKNEKNNIIKISILSAIVMWFINNNHSMLGYAGAFEIMPGNSVFRSYITLIIQCLFIAFVLTLKDKDKKIPTSVSIFKNTFIMLGMIILNLMITVSTIYMVPETFQSVGKLPSLGTTGSSTFDAINDIAGLINTTVLFSVINRKYIWFKVGVGFYFLSRLFLFIQHLTDTYEIFLSLETLSIGIASLLLLIGFFTSSIKKRVRKTNP